MAEHIAYFEADEGVSRANFNRRIEQLNEIIDNAEAEKGAAGGVATLNSSGKVNAVQASSEVVRHTGVTAYTITAADMGKYHEFSITSGSTGTVTVTIPEDGSIPLGSELEIMKVNGGLTVNIVGSSVTFYTKNSYNAASITLDNSYGLVSLKKRAVGSWVARGDIK